MANAPILAVFQQMLWIVMLVVCLLTVPTLLVGIVISIFQAATQINEMSLTFIPKLIVMFLVLMATLPWLMTRLVQITESLIYHIPQYLV